jgi:hypothetical protein
MGKVEQLDELLEYCPKLVIVENGVGIHRAEEQIVDELSVLNASDPISTVDSAHWSNSPS